MQTTLPCRWNLATGSRIFSSVLVFIAVLLIPLVFLGCDDYSWVNPVDGSGDDGGVPYFDNSDNAFYYEYDATDYSSSATYSLTFYSNDVTCSLAVDNYESGSVTVSVFDGGGIAWSDRVSSGVNESMNVYVPTQTYCTITYDDFTGHVSFSCTGSAYVVAGNREKT
ncbi:MAG TPA: hypothetical protein VLX91_02985 [Candidatus Acidoferrales bacterium]|nr:hypothetical protein [Candidatus Acidoferrales bacterium]